MRNFWYNLVSFILKNRVVILSVFAILTAIMISFAKIDFAMDYGKIVPPSDKDYKIYLKFKEEFGEDGNVVIIGVNGDLHNQAFFNDLYDFTEDCKKIEGIEGVLSMTHLINIIRNDSTEKFEVERIVKNKPGTQAETDSLANILENLPFYKGLILTDDAKTSIVAVSLTSKALDSKQRLVIFDKIQKIGAEFEKKHNTHLYYAGLPVLRATLFHILFNEIILFLGLAILVTALILMFIFRSWVSVVYPLIVVGVIIAWALGIQGMLGYKMTMITGIIPALITVVGIPNCVYFITKYHYEFSLCRNKIEALTNMVVRIGVVTVMVNATTMIGLGATGVTDIAVLREFGVVAGLTITAAFFISLFLITIIFSYLPEPTDKELKHLDNKQTNWMLSKVDYLVQNKRWMIYSIVGLILVFSFWGMSKIEVVSKMADDIPQGTRMMQDMNYMESQFKGVMPFEIVIDTKKKKGVQKLKLIDNISALQDSMKKYPEISRTLSVADFAKFARQAFNDGNPEEYDLPSKSEFNFIGIYVNNAKLNAGSFSKALTDSIGQKTRISGNIRDVGSKRMKEIVAKLQTDIDSVFSGSDYNIAITGTTRIYIKGNEYLISNLIQSLLITLLLIGILMWLLFRTFGGLMLSIIPNVLPLLMVAGFMGFAGITLKPSTALIFSTVFGISIDNTIHFLAAYRNHRKNGLGITEAVTATYDNTGLSMIYTSSILFFGFIIFVASSFGGTQALGYLIGGTLLIALFSNLLFLPAMVISFGKEKI
ncbi:MAG: MMPL family transporter [Bacteroidia bacterium]|nr:MMPL family transporter [Bacteroidia bacterium]